MFGDCKVLYEYVKRVKRLLNGRCWPRIEIGSVTMFEKGQRIRRCKNRLKRAYLESPCLVPDACLGALDHGHDVAARQVLQQTLVLVVHHWRVQKRH